MVLLLVDLCLQPSYFLWELAGDVALQAAGHQVAAEGPARGAARNHEKALNRPEQRRSQQR